MNSGIVPTHAVSEADEFSDARLLALLQPGVQACRSAFGYQSVKGGQQALRLSNLRAQLFQRREVRDFACGTVDLHLAEQPAGLPWRVGDGFVCGRQRLPGNARRWGRLSPGNDQASYLPHPGGVAVRVDFAPERARVLLAGVPAFLQVGDIR